ncbi:MAG: divalent-cation tolerance protein CutA [Fibrobacteria bacterium]
MAIKKTTYITAYITVSDRGEAERIARGLLEARLVACVNILPEVRSLYWWEGRIGESQEYVLIAKSIPAHQEGILAKVRELHGYRVPCVVFWPLSGGNPDFLAWIEKETGHA